MEELQSVNLEHVATKADIKESISDLKIDMLKFIIPVLLGQAAVFAIIVRFLLVP